MSKPQIVKCCAREILDSRGNPTVEATVFLNDGAVGVASVPSGASTGKYEAHEKRDADGNYYHGKGVMKAVYNVCKVISPAITGINACEQYELDRVLCELDGTDNKSNLGANAILAVSLACARAAANHYGIPLYRYLGGVDACRIPVPMMNILNGGAHAANNVEIQEFMILPVGAENFSEGLRMGSEIYHTLGNLLKGMRKTATVGDEGGFAPDLDSDDEAIELICDAIEKSGYTTDQVKIALDVAASGWVREDGSYEMFKRNYRQSADDLISTYERYVKEYPIISIEDGLGEEDFDAWKKLTDRLGNRVMLVGDDLFVTNSKRLDYGIRNNIANAILIKPNQIGTLSETLDVIHMAKDANYNFILSHRSGETEDTTLADIAVAMNAPFIKSGAPCRSERVAKYNRLLRIEAAQGGGAVYGKKSLLFCEKNKEKVTLS